MGLIKKGDNRHLQARRSSLTMVMAEEGAAMSSSTSPLPRLITLVGATLEDVVERAETSDEEATHLMMGLVQCTNLCLYGICYFLIFLIRVESYRILTCILKRIHGSK